jgi:hypothetical protein
MADLENISTSLPTPGYYSNSNPPKLPKAANRTVAYTKEIKYCSECPMCKLSAVYYDAEVDQDVQDLFCTKHEKPEMVHWALYWTEIAGRNSLHTGDDLIPENCPLLPNEPNNEPIGDTNNEPNKE